MRPKLDKSGNIKIALSIMTLTDSRKRVELFIYETNLGERWDQDLVAKPKISEGQSLFTSDVPRIEH